MALLTVTQTDLVKPLEDPVGLVEYDDFFTSMDPELVLIPNLEDSLESTGHTSLDISDIDVFLKKLLPDSILLPLQISEDGGFDAGCGGKLWVAGKLLAMYLINYHDQIKSLSVPNGNIIELGSGTGVVGLSLGLLLQNHHPLVGSHIHLTDLNQVIPILSQNITLNKLAGVCDAQELDWFDTNTPLFMDGQGKVDLILLADCVYDVKLFDVLVQALILLCNLNRSEGDKETEILLSFKKRRKSNARFFKILRKHFNMEEIVDYQDYPVYQKLRVHLFRLVIRR